VVVPTYKRPELLRRCLAALLAQDADPSSYEIIVADDACCEETQHIVERQAANRPVAAYMNVPERASAAVAHGIRAQMLGAQSLVATQLEIRIAEQCPQVRYLPVTGAHGPAAARNAGWRVARGALVAFTDDDCIPDPGWVRAIALALAGGAAGVSGRVIVPLPENPTDYERDAAGLENGQFVTANCGYRYDVLSAVGGFDERFTTAWREDSDLYFRLLERDYQMCYAPQAIVVHPVRPAPWGISLRQQRKSMFNALLYRKHPRIYRQRIQPAPPWHYYGSVGALLGALAGMAQRRRWLGMGGAIAWALLTGRFCARRLRGTSHAPIHLAEMIVTSALIPPLAIFWRLYGALRYRVFFL
jgi:glycosyltransferase involved in cell wall biosynthesis